jgi:hypothetical protein
VTGFSAPLPKRFPRRISLIQEPFEIRQLRYFLEVAAGNFSRAAKRLGVP